MLVFSSRPVTVLSSFDLTALTGGEFQVLGLSTGSRLARRSLPRHEGPLTRRRAWRTRVGPAFRTRPPSSKRDAGADRAAGSGQDDAGDLHRHQAHQMGATARFITAQQLANQLGRALTS